MTGPLLYKPAPRWQVFAALLGAIAVHGLAVGIAALKDEPIEVDMSQIPEAVVEMTLEQQPMPPEPTPPPEEEEPEPVEQPPPPTEVPEFVEEKPTPPPKPRTDKPRPIAPIARPTTPGPPTGPAPSGKAAMVFKPTVVYPYEARRMRATGSGVIIVSVSPDGSVTSATMGKSTGSPILDNAATSTFRSARFKPGTVPKVRIPITFTLTGASY